MEVYRLMKSVMEKNRKDNIGVTEGSRIEKKKRNMTVDK